MGVRILASSSVVPGRVVSNEELAGFLDGKPEDIFQRSGVKERRYIVQGDTGANLLAEATRAVCAAVGKEPKDLQAIVSSTLTPDHQFPGNSSFLQEALGIAGQATLDIRACDGGFLHSLEAAAALIENGLFDCLLITANDIFSTYLKFSPDGAGETELFADGAAVWILGPSDSESGILSIEVGNDPANVRSFWAEKPTTCVTPRMTPELIQSGEWHFFLDQDVMEKEARRLLPDIIERALYAAKVKIGDVSLFIPSVLKLSWAMDISRELGVPDERVLCMNRNRGYYGTAIIPDAIDQALRSGLLKKCDLVLAAAVGSGVGFGAMVYRV